MWKLYATDREQNESVFVTETVNKPIPSPRVVTDTAQTRASDEMIDNLPETTDEGTTIVTDMSYGRCN